MTDVIEWLESPEGEAWSRAVHERKYELVSIKALAFPVIDFYLWVA